MAETRTVREAPSGRRLDDGFSTVVTLERDPDIKLWEKTVTPVGLDGEEAIDTKTMFNLYYRTKAPRALITVPEFTFKCAYDVAVYDAILEEINCNQTITIWFPDGSAVYFYGYLRSFIPDEVSEGQQPEATVTICPTMFDQHECAEGAFYVYQPTGSCWPNESGQLLSEGCHPGAPHLQRPGPG